ncbi:Uncharacterized conserved protein YgbK, DUF1537 family [Tistlia consotensis]|uniref:3-oxo-tetronate kinase n=1 Tax=Tistlia consotensis USBA 355 TaxID=560819 RepID=A0A1Y6CTA3_9PROT|nr:3-oxo-tetronate kinase [Tistlia consotensis]SMF75481.1 Uncharacterized conserved protein YgbK, DUF1537 family [Tistlia consotensis USBA 355]SNS07979.1 Uncharacterized conserved protein YgbK, DUF1537 family [Tistlia consotensis]
MLLGCIGDDFTGSSDLGSTLVKEGFRTVQYCGVPERDAEPDVEAGIVALKSRTCPANEAIADSLAALDWLRRQGCRQFFFKYCSTFDSRPDGNIGPVAEALMKELGADRALFCPAFPANGRRIFQGHLFVGDRLLSESGMERHPLTPMTDPDIRRWLALQTTLGVGHVPLQTIRQGPAAVAAALDGEVAAGRPFVVLDAVADEDLRIIGKAAAGVTLVTGGSGVALGLPANFRDQGAAGEHEGTAGWHAVEGPAVVLSGSCSTATRGQVAVYAERHPSLAVDPEQVLCGKETADSVAEWVAEHLDDAPLVYSTADPEAVGAAQSAYGRDRVAAAIERFFAGLAATLDARGVRRFVVAGGETSGAVTAALGAGSLRIGPEIAPGVPALLDDAGRGLALKSGNFGAPDFFERALGVLASGA